MAGDAEISVRLVRALSGEEIARVQPRLADTVDQLQRAAASHMGMSQTAVLLILGGRTLQLTETLHDAGLEDDGFVHVMCRRGGLVVSSGHDRFARIWDVDSGQNVLSIQEQHRVNGAAVSPDGGLLATACDDSTAKLWHAKSGECLRSLAGHAAAVMSVSFSLDGRLIVTGSRDRSAMLWEVATGERLQHLVGHAGSLRPALFSEDGELVATGSEDCSLRVWRARDGKVVWSLHGHTSAVFAAAFSPDGSSVLSGSFDGTAMLWSLATGECLKTMVPHKAESLCAVAFSPDGQALMTCSPFDREVIVWGADKMERRRVLLHSKMPSSAAWLPDGRTVVTGTCVGLVNVWSSETGECVRSITAHKGLVTSMSFAGM